MLIFDLTSIVFSVLSLLQGGPKETKGCKSLITFLFINFFLFFLSDYIDNTWRIYNGEVHN